MPGKIEDVIVVEKREGVDIVYFLIPRLTDPMIANDIKSYLSSIIPEGKDHLVFNFTSVQYLSSAYLGILIALDKSVRPRGGKINICCLAPDIAKVFSIAGFDAIFDILPTEGAAIVKMREHIK
ncbi:MAG: STAS domain-containing protein [Candidatus Auribacterota bacterium]|nr:STAS domain-containing protein [Candidatus Auribacterota bacterium]